MERPRKRLAPRILAWVILAVAVAAPLGYFYFYEEPIEVTTMIVRRGHVEQTVAAISSGTVMAKADSMIASGLMGIVVDVPAEEGRRVAAGDLLVELDHAELDAQITQAKAGLAAGLSGLQAATAGAAISREVAETGVDLAEDQLAVAQTDFDRVRKLSEEKAISQSELDAVELALSAARSNLGSARASQRQSEVHKAEVSSAKSRVEQLKAAVAVAEAIREKASVKAPFPGVVAKVFMDVGEAVGIGMPLVQLVQDKDFYVEAPFDEANAAEIALAQKARINLDAYRDVNFIGEVMYISPVVSINRDLSRTIDVKIKVVEGQEKFLAGMSADVTIVVDEKEDVLFVPSESLVREQYVYIVKNGRRAERRGVNVGLGNWNTKEIVNGLEEGDTLITSVSIKELADGVRVRIVESFDY